MEIDPRVSCGRLILRPLEIHDAEAVYRYRSNASVNRFQGWIPSSINDVKEFITHRISPEINVPETWFQMAIVDQKSEEFIGDIGIHFLKSNPEIVELGITIDLHHQRKGFAREALSALFPVLFIRLGKKQVLAEIDWQNIGSIGLFNCLGFISVEPSLKALVIREDYPDDLVLGLSREDWELRRSLTY